MLLSSGIIEKCRTCRAGNVEVEQDTLGLRLAPRGWHPLAKNIKRSFSALQGQNIGLRRQLPERPRHRQNTDSIVIDDQEKLRRTGVHLAAILFPSWPVAPVGTNATPRLLCHPDRDWLRFDFRANTLSGNTDG
jgi:hypothetical protein